VLICAPFVDHILCHVGFWSFVGSDLEEEIWWSYAQETPSHFKGQFHAHGYLGSSFRGEWHISIALWLSALLTGFISVQTA
jgi:hypothetical protein